MKRILYFWLCVALSLLNACEGGKYPQSLLVADSLSYSCPDSVLTLLKGWEEEMNGQPEPVRKYYQLLCLQTEDRTGIRHESDSLAQALVRYYEATDNSRLLSEACYLAGRIYTDLSDTLRALHYFNRALDALIASKDTLTGTMYQGRKERTFLWQDFWQEAGKAYPERYRQAITQGDTLMAVYCLLNAGFLCEMQGELKQAERYYSKAENMAESQGNDYLAEKAYNQSLQILVKLNEKQSHQMQDYTLYLQHALYSLMLTFMLTCFIWYYLNVRKRHRLQQEKLQQLQEELRLKSPGFIAANEQEQERLEKQLQEANGREEDLQRHRQELSYLRKRAEAELEYREAARRQLQSTDIYVYFMELCQSKEPVGVPESKWNELQQVVNSLYRNMTERLLQIHKLSKHELRICLLIKIGIPPTKMAELTCHSPESISAVRRRMYQKFFNEKGTPQQWDDLVELL